MCVQLLYHHGIAIPTIIMGGNAIPYFTLLKYPVLRAGIRYSKQLSSTQIDLVLKDVIDDSRIRLTSYRFTNHYELLPYEL